MITTNHKMRKTGKKCALNIHKSVMNNKKLNEKCAQKLQFFLKYKVHKLFQTCAKSMEQMRNSANKIVSYVLCNV